MAAQVVPQCGETRDSIRGDTVDQFSDEGLKEKYPG
jgi:hypothetical protein